MFPNCSSKSSGVESQYANLSYPAIPELIVATKEREYVDWPGPALSPNQTETELGTGTVFQRKTRVPLPEE